MITRPHPIEHVLGRFKAALAHHFDLNRSGGRVYVFMLLGPGALAVISAFPPHLLPIFAYLMGGLVAWAMRVARDTDVGPKTTRVITLVPGDKEEFVALIATLLYRLTDGHERALEIDGRDLNAVKHWSVESRPTTGPWGTGVRIRLRRPGAPPPIPGPGGTLSGPGTSPPPGSPTP